MPFNEKQYVRKMVDNLGQQEVEGLGYGILHGYVSGETQDKEFDKAVKLAEENLAIVESKLAEFAEDVHSGKYEKYLDKYGQVKY